MSNTSYLDAENYYNVVRNSNSSEIDTAQENDFADKINAYNAFDPAMRQQSINNYNGALKYNLPALGDYEYMAKTVEQPKITQEAEQKVKRYAPSSAQLFAMADSANSLVVQEYFKNMAQYEKSMRDLYASDAPKDIKDISASKVMPYKQEGYNAFESVLYGALYGTNQAKIGLEATMNDYADLSLRNSLPEELQNVDLKSVTEDMLWDIAKQRYPENEKVQNNFVIRYKDTLELINRTVDNLFENAPEWAETAKKSGTINNLVFDVSAGIAQFLPLVAASAASGGTAASAFIPMLGSFGMMYGQSIYEYRQDPLVNPENIRTAALINAGISSVLETVGVKGIAKNFLKPQTAFGQAVKGWLVGAGKEGGTEYLQAYPELLARQFAQGKFDNADAEAIKHLLQEYFTWTFQSDALYQGLVGTIAGGAIGAFGIKGEYKNRANQFSEITEASRIAKEQPEIFQRFVGQLKSNGVEIPDVYVSAKVIDSLKQERSPEMTDFDKQPLEIFLEEAGISQEEFETSLASGSTLEIQGERLHKILQTDIGMRLLQDNAISTSSRFETDGMDSLLTSLYQQKKMQDDAENFVNAHVEATKNANADFDEYNEYTLKEELEMSPEEYAEAQNVQAYMDVQEKAYNEEKYLSQQIASDIEENTRLTDNPYSPTQSKTLAALFMAEIKTYAENYNIPLQEAYKQRRPLFLGNVASTQDIDTLIAQAKEEVGLANFNKDAVERENALYQQQIVREGITRKPDSETVNVVTLPDVHAPEFAHMQEFAKWAKEMLEAGGGDVVISSTGQTAQFSTKNVKASAKRARTKTHRDAYLSLREMVKNAEYDHYEPKDERHPNSGGQDVYYSALNMGGKLYSVRIKLDALTEEQKQSQKASGKKGVADVDYKDHKLTEIEIAPTLYAGVPENRQSNQEIGAISNVSLGVIRGNVKPSGISENTLYQLAERENQSIEKVRQEYEGTDKWLKAPNGKDTKLTERQWLQVRTPEFKAWFGDWENNPENASKVVDENGEPLVVYHGTPNNFDVFDKGKQKLGQLGKAFYFTSNQQEAAEYSKNSNVMPVFLNMQKALELSEDIDVLSKELNIEKGELEKLTAGDEKLKKAIKEKGFTGIIAKDFWENGTDYYAVFEPNQIKSSVNNNGDFDANNPSILYQNNSVIQGSITPVEGAKSIIRFFTATDISTGFHEFGHYMRFSLEQKAKLENAREQDITDYKTACEFVGAKEGEVWTREQEEKFADAVLEYLHSGEAPSKGLKRVFANVARWLTRLYEKISRSGVEINPEIKAVFDRQLATEKEILAARQKLGISETNTALTNIQEKDLNYLSDTDREKYNALIQEADVDAYSALTEKKGKELEENRKVWKNNAELAYKIDSNTKELERIVEEGGIYLDEDMRMEYAESLKSVRRARPFQYDKIFTTDKSKSVDIDEVAERFGFEGASDIANVFGHLANIPNKQTFIADYMAEQEMLWRSEWKAEEIVLNDKVEEALELLSNGLAEKIGVTNLDNKKLRRAVISALKDNKIADVEKYIDKYETTARESSVLEKAQARKIEKLEEKIIRQRLEFINQKRIALAVLREKYKAKEMRNKGIRYVKRAAKTMPKNMDFEYLEQIKALGNKFGFTGKSLMPRDRENLPSLKDFVEKKTLDKSIFPEWLLASPQDENISYKDLTVEEFAELMDVFKVLEHHGKDIKQIEIAGKTQTLDNLVMNLENSLFSLKSKTSLTEWEKENTIKGKSLSTYRQLAAELTDYTYVFGSADGFLKGHEIVNGIHYQTFLKPLYDAQGKSYLLNSQIQAQIDAVFEPVKKMSKAKRLERWTVDVPLSDKAKRKYGETNNWNYEKMIMVALNMGNADNKKKLMDGYGWTEQDLAKLTERMTLQDWQMVQNIWNTINTLFPELNRVYKEINGIPMKKVVADKLQTPYGVFDGGYFPLAYDRDLADVNQQDKMKLDDIFNNNEFGVNVAKAVDGFTKDRMSGVKIPVKLSYDVIPKHITDTVQYICYAKPVYEIRKIIRNEKFAKTFTEKFGEDIYKGLEPWLANIAKPQQDTISTWENMLEGARKLGTVYALGYNIKTALLSFTGITPIIKEIGFDGFAYGAIRGLKNPKQAYQEVQKMSLLMADRPQNINQDIAMNMAKYNPTNAPVITVPLFGKNYDFYWKDLQKYAFSFVTFTDMMVCYSGWMGAYHKALMKNGGDIENAKAYADMVVERSQSSGTAMHLTALQRGKGLKKIITMFMTYSLNVQNYLAYETRGLMEGKISIADYITFMLGYFTCPAIMTVAITGLWNDGAIPNVFSDDDEEKDKAMKEYFKEIFINSYLQGLPVIRNFGSYYDFGNANFSSSSIIDKGIVSPVDSLFYGYEFAKSFFDDSIDGDKQFAKFIKSSINATSYWTAIPAHRVFQIYEKVGKVIDWYSEKK